MIIQLAILIAVIVLIIILFFVVKRIFLLIINSIIGLFALFGFNWLFNTDVAISFWSVIITAIGGVIGFLIVIGMHFLGLAF